MNSHFSGLNNRQKINDYKKNNRREKLDSRKKSLEKISSNEENPIPTVPDEKLNRIIKRDTIPFNDNIFISKTIYRL